MARKINTYGLTVDIKDLKKVARATSNYGLHSPEYDEVFYDRSTGEVWSKYQYSIGQNCWTEYSDPNIIKIGNYTNRITRQELMDHIKQKVDELQAKKEYEAYLQKIEGIVQTPPVDKDEMEPPKLVPAQSLPDGWVWEHYDDGSGGLRSPEGQSYFSYDIQPYHPVGIEYHRTDRERWGPYWGSFQEFQEFAEKDIQAELERSRENTQEQQMEQEDVRQQEPEIEMEM